MAWILIISFGFPVGFAFGILIEMYYARRKRKNKIKKSRRALARSVEYAGRRLAREDRIMSILNEPVSIRKREPIRKVCGVFSDDAAQKILQ